jgi:hypothetical protein
LNAPTPRRAAASVLVRDVLEGPVTPLGLVATGPQAAYLDVAGRLVAVVTPAAVRLPCAVVVPALSDVDAVGAGAMWHAGEPVVRVARWFDPRLRVLSTETVALATVSVDKTRDALLPPDAVHRFAAALASGDARAAVRPLLGRGTGLTPAGDDLVAGALAALRAVAPDSPPADALGAAVRALAAARTTRLSAALLAAADEAAVIPEAAAVLRALAGVGDLDAALARLCAVGHTSGSYLAAGLLVGARLAADLVGAA